LLEGLVRDRRAEVSPHSRPEVVCA
jgi:hypothetical protein